MSATSAFVPCLLPAILELLVLAWGVFFISASREREPQLKARNFAKSLRVASSTINSKMKKRRLGQPTADADGESRPEWDAARNDRNFPTVSESGAREDVSRETGASIIIKS